MFYVLHQSLYTVSWFEQCLWLIPRSYGERPIEVLANFEPPEIALLPLRRSRIFIGVASTIEYRSVRFRFVLLWPVSLSGWLRRRFLALNLTTEYWSSSNRTILIGVTFFGAFRGEFGLVPEEEIADCLLGVLRPGEGVRNRLLLLMLLGGDGVAFLVLFSLFWGVDFGMTGDLLLVCDL